MKLFDRREGNASLWGMANGNSSAFKELASLGMRPQGIDGTLTISDRFTMFVRLTMANPNDATRMASELDKVKGPLGNMVERFETHAEGELVTIAVVVTEAQLRTIVGMMGGMLGP
jgi:hypothetical protein